MLHFSRMPLTILAYVKHLKLYQDRDMRIIFEKAAYRWP